MRPSRLLGIGEFVVNEYRHRPPSTLPAKQELPVKVARKPNLVSNSTYAVEQVGHVSPGRRRVDRRVIKGIGQTFAGFTSSGLGPTVHAWSSSGRPRSEHSQSTSPAKIAFETSTGSTNYMPASALRFVLTVVLSTNLTIGASDREPSLRRFRPA